MTIRRLLGAASALPVLIGGLLLVTARPAAACSCAQLSEAQQTANADAIFVGTLIDRLVDQPAGAIMGSAVPAVWTFEVSRVYKGTVSERQESVTAVSGASCGLELSGSGPFLVFAVQPSRAEIAKTWWGNDHQLAPGQYVSHLCLGSRPLAAGGDPTTGGPPASSPLPADTPPSASSSPPSSLAIGAAVLAVGAAAGLGWIAFRARRRTTAD